MTSTASDLSCCVTVCMRKGIVTVAGGGPASELPLPVWPLSAHRDAACYQPNRVCPHRAQNAHTLQTVSTLFKLSCMCVCFVCVVCVTVIVMV